VAEKREKLETVSAKEPRVNILLVDDRVDGLLALEAVLSSPEWNLITARSGQEALTQLSETEFAAILLDIQMPGLDGFQTAARIKDNPAWKDIPILFITAIHQDTSYIHRGYKEGAVDYIFKPFDPYILRSKITVFAELYRKNAKLLQAQEELRRKEEELYQARKLEAIGKLAGGVAHDFNNIAAGILGLSEELRDMFEPGDRRYEDLNEIIKATHRAFSLTRQLLVYARRQVISPEVLNLNAVVLDMQGMLSRLIGEDVQMNTDLEPKLGLINADRGYLEQVVINLVLNARDAMPEGGVVTIKTSNVQLAADSPQDADLQLLPGPYVALTVSDTGCGMNDEVLSHIFEPFFTTKERDNGTGLGLATVYGIVKQNGGDIAVHSRPGSGTRMSIYLPRVVQEELKPIVEKLPSEPARGSETILLVEDEHLVRRVVMGILRKNGYTVLDAGSGPEAVELFERYQGPIDLLITDVVMPELNGRQLADLIVARRPGVAVLYMSGYTKDIIARRGILEPGIHFIEKSEICSELTNKVRQVLQARRQQDGVSVLN